MSWSNENWTVVIILLFVYESSDNFVFIERELINAIPSAEMNLPYIDE